MKKIVLLFTFFALSFGAFSQNSICNGYGATEDDSLQCLEQITLFRQFTKQKDYPKAYEHWRNVIAQCPCSWNGIYTNSSIQNIFEALIKQSKAAGDTARAEVLVDSLIWVYTVRSTYFPDKYSAGEDKGWIAYNMTRFRQKEFETAYPLFIEAIESSKEETQPIIFNVFFGVSQVMTKAKKDTTYVIDAYERATTYLEQAIDNYNKQLDKIMPSLYALDSNLAAGTIDSNAYKVQTGKIGKDTAKVNKYISNYAKTLGNIESKFTPYAPCHVLDQIYGKKLAENRDNLTVLKKIIHTMQKSDCSKSDIFVEALEIVHKAEPSANSAYQMGLRSLGRADYDAAVAYFKEAISMFETNEKKANAYFFLATTLQAKENYSESRAAALEAIKLKPNMGKAYMLIGDLYHYSGRRCSGEGSLPNANNWAAADKYSRALAVDPSLEQTIREKRSKLAFPSDQDKFVRGLQNGSSYRVGCWINETTTVR